MQPFVLSAASLKQAWAGPGAISEGPYTAHSKTLVPKTIAATLFGMRALKWAVYGPFGSVRLQKSRGSHRRSSSKSVSHGSSSSMPGCQTKDEPLPFPLWYIRRPQSSDMVTPLWPMYIP